MSPLGMEHPKVFAYTGYRLVRTWDLGLEEIRAISDFAL